MDRFLLLPAERRRVMCDEGGRILGLSSGSVEKDLWICWTLRALCELPAMGRHLTFKGGTSLSKGWKLIHRFSEDIDLVIDRVSLGFGGDRSPEATSSQKQRAKRLEGLKSVCQRHVVEALLPALNERIRHALPTGNVWRLEIDPADTDRQTLLFHYPGATAEAGYIRPTVKLEFGARSDTEPSTTPMIAPYLADVFPNELSSCAFTVPTIAPERTFWEKVALLHEEGHRAGDDGPRARLARHYYDLWCLLSAGVGDRARADMALFERVVAHRAVYFRRSRQAQDSLRRGSLRLVPAADRRAAWKRDYDAMRESMFFEEPPAFDEILTVVATFEQEFNRRD